MTDGVSTPLHWLPCLGRRTCAGTVSCERCQWEVVDWLPTLYWPHEKMQCHPVADARVTIHSRWTWRHQEQSWDIVGRQWSPQSPCSLQCWRSSALDRRLSSHTPVIPEDRSVIIYSIVQGSLLRGPGFVGNDDFGVWSLFRVLSDRCQDTRVLPEPLQIYRPTSYPLNNNKKCCRIPETNRVGETASNIWLTLHQASSTWTHQALHYRARILVRCRWGS